MAKIAISFSWLALSAATSIYLMVVSGYPMLQVTSCEVFDMGFDCEQSLLNYFGFSYMLIVALVAGLCLAAALRVERKTAYMVSAALALLWVVGVGETVLTGSPNVVGILAYVLPTVALAFVLSIVQGRYTK